MMSLKLIGFLRTERESILDNPTPKPLKSGAMTERERRNTELSRVNVQTECAENDESPKTASRRFLIFCSGGG